MIPLGSAYHENFSRGSLDFPFDYHYINPAHPRFVMPFHYHVDYEILRVIKGGLSINLNERHYHLEDGDYLFIGEGVVHGGEPDNAGTIYECVVFNLAQMFDVSRPDFSWLQQLATHQMSIEELYTLRDNPDVALCMDEFFTSVKNKDHNCALTYGKLLTMIGKILEGNHYTLYTNTMSNRYLKHLNKSSQLFRYIYDNFANDITLEDMAGAVNLNPKYFCRFFKELTSYRPMDYLNRFRIDCAAIRLTTYTETVNQIAYTCGFKDPCYFTKLFKRYKKVSPREYRNIHSGHMKTLH